MATRKVPEVPVTEVTHYDRWATYKRGETVYVCGTQHEVEELIRVMSREAKKFADPDQNAIELAQLLRMLDGVDRWLGAHRVMAYGCGGFRAWLTRQIVLQDPERIARIREQQLIQADEFDFLFEVDTEVSVLGDVGLYGGIIDDVTLVQSFLGAFWQVTLNVIRSDSKGHASPSQEIVRIATWDGQRAADTLPIRPLTPEVRAKLTARGQLFVKYGLGVQYLHYEGTLSVPTWYSTRRFRGDGRVMIDNASLEHFDPDIAENFFGSDTRLRRDLDDEEGHAFALKEEDYWRTWPQVPAFSFVLKRWGFVDVEQLTPIAFREDAFDLLVLDPEIKHLVHSLVKHSGDSFADFIDGKSGGCIFLLHGEPGVGKTLTAEAVAETLQRPLYAVSVGELGTDPGDLERALRKILDMATRWNAVLLLDEADIFLEARTQHDIFRNAMVGVFLRLLEYHAGVLFLTTNRVRNFDPAFHSRITVALHYPSLTTETREQVIRNLFGKAGVEHLEIDELVDQPLNGRQLKNTLRIAQTLAKAADEPLNEDHLARVVDLTAQFQAFLTGGPDVSDDGPQRLSGIE